MSGTPPAPTDGPEAFDRVAALRAFVEESEAFGLEELQLSPLTEAEGALAQGPPSQADSLLASQAKAGQDVPISKPASSKLPEATPAAPAVQSQEATESPEASHQPPPGASPELVLAEVAAEVAACTRCGLCESRTKTVPGQGNPQARLMFVGEAPGADEDLQGLAFVGRAGQLLSKMILAMGLSREEVFIANILKCRPPGNRDPREDEAAACISYLERQIQAVRPELIVALGAQAMRGLLKTTAPVGRMRGKMHQYQQTPLIVTYHPAYLLRSPQMKRGAWEDLQGAMSFLGLTPPPRAKS